jgi:membrane carboxypeptidase/penicillin-binding protein PbpC
MKEKDFNNVNKGIINMLSILNHILLSNKININKMRNLYSNLVKHRIGAFVALMMMVFIVHSNVGKAQGIEVCNYVSKTSGHVVSSQSNLSVEHNREVEYVLELRNASSIAYTNSVIEIAIPYYADFYSIDTTIYRGTTAGTAPYYDASTRVITWDISSIPAAVLDTLLAQLVYTLVSSNDCYVLNSSCEKAIAVTGKLTTSSMVIIPFVYGYHGSTLPTPVKVTIDAAAFLSTCTDQYREYAYFEGSTAIPVSDISDDFAIGATFYNTIDEGTGAPTGTNYTATGFPRTTAARNMYYACFANNCWQKFYINVLDTTDIVYCAGDTMKDARVWISDWDEIVSSSGKWLFDGAAIDITKRSLLMSDSGDILKYEANQFCGNDLVTSNGIVINVCDDPEITDTTYLLSYCIGNQLTASVGVDPHGSSIISYVWTLEGTTIGGNSSTLSYGPLTAADNGKLLRLVVTNGCGTDTMSITVNVLSYPITLTCPNNVVYSDVSTEHNSCAAVVNYSSDISPGTGTNVSYRYEFSGVTTGSGAGTGSGSSFNLGATTVKVYAFNDCSIDSCEFIITVQDHQVPSVGCKPEQNKQPVSGQDYYQVSGAEFDANVIDNCAGAITLTHNITQSGVSSTSLDGARFYMGTTVVKWTAIDANGNEDSCKLTVKVGTAPVIAAYPSLTICGSDGVVKLWVTSPAPTLEFATYQWYKASTPIIGAIDSVLYVDVMGDYKCELTYKVSGTKEFSNVLTVQTTSSSQPQPDLVSIPTSGNLCAGDGDVYLYVANTSAYINPVYMWYKDDALIANTASYYNATVAGQYHVIVVEGSCAYKSNTKNVLINSTTITAPVISALNSITNICGQDGKVILQVTSSHTGTTITYTWFKGTTPIVSSNRPVYETTEAGDYKVMIEIDGCAAESTPITVTKTIGASIKAPTLDILPSNAEICGTGGKVYVRINNIADYTNPTFKWFRNDTLQTSLTDSFIIVDVAGKYFVVVTDGSCLTQSTNVNVTKGNEMITKPNVASNPSSNIICGTDGVVVLQLQNISDYAGHSPTYQWYNGNALITGANSAVYSASTSGDYYLMVITNQQCVSVSDTFKVQLNIGLTIALPVVIMSPTNGQIVPGSSSAVLTLTNVAAYASPVYQWYKDTLPIQGAIAANYTATTAGSYRLLVVDGGCARWSDNFKVEETSCTITLPTLAMQPSSGKVCLPYGSVLIQLTNVSSYINPTYQWYDGAILLTGKTNPTIEVTAAGDYRIEVTADISPTNPNRCNLSSNAAVVVLDNGSFTAKPSISRTPVNGAICGAEGSVLLSFDNSSVFFGMFNWVKDGYEIPNATGLTYLATEAGKYQMLVKDGSCSVLSTVEDITVNTTNIDKPLIVSTSGETNICQGNGSILLRLTNGVDYSGNATYQWYKNGAKLTGETNNFYIAQDAGHYHLQVIEGTCSSMSDSLEVTKNGITNIDKPLLSKLPNTQEICQGGTVYYFVSNSSTYPTTAEYIWYNATGIVKQQSTDSFYTATTAGVYFVQVVSGSCSSVSSFDTLKNNISNIAKPQIVSTGGTNLCQGTSAIVLQLQNGSAFNSSVTYQWFRNDVPITGATTSVYTVTDSGSYKIMIIDGSCSSMSDLLHITKNGNGNIAAPAYTKQPNSTTICTGGTVVYSITNTTLYTSSAQYIWFRDTAIVQQGNLSSYIAADSGIYYVEVVDASCASVSDRDTLRKSLTPVVPAEIESVSGNTQICGNNGVVILSLRDTALHTGSTYQWYRNNVAISGANDIIYQATDSGSYKLQVIQGSCSSMSLSVYVTKAGNELIAKPNLTRTPSSGQMCLNGGSVLLTVTNSSDYNTGSEYVWYHDNHIVSKGTAPTYIAEAGGTYFVQVIDGNCSSSSLSLLINQSASTIEKAKIVSTSGGTVICSGTGIGMGGSIVLQLSNGADYNSSATYQWYKNNVAISSATERIYTATDSGEYRIMVVEGGCSTMSDLIKVTKDGTKSIKKPTLAKYPSNGEICDGAGSVVLFVVDTNSYINATYQWMNDTGIVQSGSSPSYVVTVAGDYFVQVIEGGCSSESAKIEVEDNIGITPVTKPEIVSVSGSLNICQGAATLLLRVNNSGAYSNNAAYQWYRNGYLLTGETQNYYIAQDSGIYRVQVVDGVCSSVSDSMKITKDGTGSIVKPTVQKSPDVNVICTGGEIYYTVSNHTSYANPKYIWYKDTSIVQQGQDFNYRATSSGIYFVQVVEGSCSSVSDKDTLQGDASSVEKPIIVSTSGGTNICGTDGSVVLHLSNASAFSGSVTYQWYKNNAAIPGETQPNYTVTDAGAYCLQVTIAGTCSSVSDSIKVTKDGSGNIQKPLVVKDPQTSTICATGGTIQLSVSNANVYTSATYKWFNDTGVIQSGTSSVLYVNKAGDYYVQVIEGSCSSVSAIETIQSSGTTIEKAVITSNTQIICGDASVAFLSLTNANSYTSATYQWYKNDTLINGATSKTYTATESGLYRIRVTEGSCITYSDSIRVTKTISTIDKPVTLLYPPDGLLVGISSVVKISVVNTSDFTSPTYTWYLGSDSVGITDVYNATQTGVYYVVVKDVDGCSSISKGDTVKSSNSMVPRPIVSTHPSSDTICGNEGSVVLTVTNTNKYVSPIYKWYKGGVQITVNGDSSVYVATEAGIYTVIVTDTGFNSQPSIPDTIYKVTTNMQKPLLTRSSTSTDLCQGGSFMLTVNNSSNYGSNSKYVWYKGVVEVQNSNNPAYVVKDAGNYWVQVIDGSCSSTSAIDTIEIGNTSIIKATITSLTGTNLCGTSGIVTLSLSNSTTDYTAPTYTWYRNDTLLVGETNITLNVYTAGNYRIQVADGACTSISDIINVTQDGSSVTKPILTRDPLLSELCGKDGVVYLYVLNKGSYTNASYRWYRNDTLILTATTWHYDVTVAGKYMVEVTDGLCSSWDTTTVYNSSNVIDKPTIATSPNNNVICGNSGVVIVTVTNTHLYSTNAKYQWYKDYEKITVAGTDSIYIAADSGLYRVAVIDGSCVSFSDTVRIRKDAAVIEPPLVISSSGNILCSGGSILLNIDNTGDYSPAVQYIWYRGTEKLQSGSSNIYEVKVAGTYYVQVIDGLCASISDTLRIESGGNVTQPTINSVSGSSIICGQNGSLTLQLSNRSLYGNISIQWYKNNVLIPGATQETYEVYVKDTGIYKVQIREGVCGSFSDTLGVRYDENANINKPLTSSSSPSLLLCSGGKILLRVTNTTDYAANARYVWYQGATIVQDSTISVYEVSATGIYYVQVIDGNCSARSNGDTVKQSSSTITPVVIASASGDVNICKNTGSIILRLTNGSYSSNATYQWYKDNVAISGADTIMYIAQDSGLYMLEIIDGLCSTVSNSVKVTKDGSDNGINQPILSRIPSSGDLCTGGSVYYYVSNANEYPNATYHWFRGYVLLQSGSQSYYTATTGGAYSVQVVASSCSSLSEYDTLNINTNSSITTPQIVSTTGATNLCQGVSGIVLQLTNGAAFSTSATYQWFKNNVLITGATTSVYTVTDSGNYKIMVIDGSCSAISDSIHITKNGNGYIPYAPVYVKQPNSTIICGGGNIVYTITNANVYSANAQYIWFKDATIVQQGTQLSYVATDSGVYYVEVIDGLCSSVSAKDVIRKTSGTSIPVDIESVSGNYVICAGDNPSNGVVVLWLKDTALHTGSTYLWYRNNVAISGATNIIYQATDSGSYQLQVIQGGCSSMSSSVYVGKDGSSLINKPTITKTPLNGQICMGGGSVLLTVNSSGYNTGTEYVWYHNNYIVSRGTAPTYIATSAGTYFVQVIEGSCSSSSSPISISSSQSTIEQAKIVSTSGGTVICSGTGAGNRGSIVMQLSNGADYSSNATYQWYKNNVAIAGATGRIYTTTDRGLYRIMVIDGVCSTISDSINVTKDGSHSIRRPLLAKHPSNGEICDGDGSVIISVTNTTYYSSTAIYQWMNDTGIVQSGSSPSYVATVAGDYLVQVVDGGCSSESLKITIEDNIGSTSITSPIVVSVSGATNICQDAGSLLLRVTNGSAYSSNATYQWYRNGYLLTGATENYYIAQDSGIYRVQVVDGVCSSVSDSVVITKDGTGNIPNLTVQKNPNVNVICTGGEVYYEVVNNTSYSNAQYIWYKDTGIVKQGAEPYYHATSSGIYFVQVIEGNCSSVSNKDTLIHGGSIEPVTISSVSGGQIVCGTNGAVMLKLNNRGKYGNITLQWYKDNILIPGAVFETYEVYAADTGVYKLYVQEGNCASSSDTMGVWFDDTKQIENPVVISSSPTSVLCTGGSILLSVTNTVDYSQNARYVWYNGHTIVQDSAISVYELNTTGIYYVQVVDGNCSSLSDKDTIVQGASSITPPEIVANPNSGTICGSEGVVILRLTNANVYNNPIITWYKNNVIIPGDTQVIYIAKDTGLYRVHVTEGNCTAFSGTIKVTKDNNKYVEPPVVLNQSQTTSLCSGGTILLSVDNVGDYNQNARYIWYKGDTIMQDSTIVYYEVKEAGTYFVQVIDGNCSSISRAKIKITSGGSIYKPEVTAVPQSSTLCGNNGVVLLTLNNVNDYTSPTIQWYKNNVLIPGATENVYIVRDSGLYRVLVMDGSCSAFSDPTKVQKDTTKTIDIPVLISSSPTLELCTGGTILLSVNNTGSYGQNAHYIWYKGLQKLQDSTISNYEVTTTGTYFVQVVDGNCSAISKWDTVVSSGTIIIKPDISSLPVSNTICGDSGVVILTLDNKGDYTTPAIQWYNDNVAIPGANQDIYVAKTAGLYRVHVIDGNCSAFSDTVRLNKTNSTIANPMISSSSPINEICAPNGSVLLTVTNTGSYSSNVRYIWYHKTGIVQDSTISAYETQDSGAYFVQVIDGACSAISTTITLTKTTSNFAQPLVSPIPGSADICGDTGVVILYVTNANVYSNPSYQWYKGSELIQGAVSSIYSATDSGDYRVLVIEGNCSGFSSIVHVSKTTTTIDKPVIVSYPPTGRIYGGNPVKLFLQNKVYTSPTYYWYKGDSLVTMDSVCNTAIAGKYRLLIEDGNCAAWSNEITLVDTACNMPSFISKNMSMCDSTTFDLALAIDTMSANTVMKYYKDPLAQNELPSSIIEPHVTTTYYLRSLDTLTGCRSIIQPVVITVITKPVLPNPVADMIYANGSVIPSYMFSGTTPGASYPWAWVSGDSIIGLPKSGTTFIQAFTAVNTDTLIKSATYMYTTDVSSSGIVCYAADTAYFDIIILPTPDVNIKEQDQIVCSGSIMDTVAFTGRISNTVYSWTRTVGTYPGLPATGAGDIQDSVLINNGSSPLTLTYQVTPTFTYRGVTSTGTSKNFTITINPQPVLSEVPDMSYCRGVVVPAYQFSGTTGMIYAWTKLSGDSIGMPDHGTGALPAFTTINSGQTPKVAIYEVTATYTNNGVACNVKDTFSISVNPYVTVNPIADIALCNHDSLSVLFTGTGNIYTWENTSIDIIDSLPFSGTGDIHIPSVNNRTQRILSAVYKVTAGYAHALGVCNGEAVYFKISLAPTPVLTSNTNMGTICSESSITYTATSSVLDELTYAWTRIADPNINGGSIASGQTAFIKDSLVNTSDTTIRVTYEVTLTVAGCSQTYPVIVDVLPAIQVSIQYRNEVCIGEPVVEIPYTSSNRAEVDYTITFSTAALNVGFVPVTTPVRLSGSQISIAMPSGVLPSGTTPYEGTVHLNVGSCTKDIPFVISVLRQTRIITQPVSQTDLCDGESLLTLRVQADGDNLSYQWYRDGLAISGATSDIYEEPFITEMEGNYYVEVTGICGTVTSDTVEVKLRSLQIEEKWDDALYVGNPQREYVRYQWYKNGIAIPSGSTFQYYTDPHGFVGTYRVRAYYADGSYVESCSKTLNRSKSRKMVLFPNPVRSGSTYKIELDGEDLDNATIEIVDVLSKVIETHVLSGDYIELRAWYAAGSYSIRIITKEGIRIKKLIVR